MTWQGAAPKIVVIFGPPASGKMTVARAIAKQTELKVLHNHMTIDVLTEFFEFGSPPFELLVERIRVMILDEIAQAGGQVAMTAGWRFDVPLDREIVDSYCGPFLERAGRAHFVELRTNLQTQLLRNGTEERRRSKKLDWATDQYVRQQMTSHRYFSQNDFPYPDEHLIIDNTHVSADEAAAMVIRRFSLTKRQENAQ
jgi:hypothetical protein